METERSAGVVVYVQGGGGRHYLLLDYGRYWDFPKGHLEAGEDDHSAAVRELREETGLTDVLLNPSFHHEIEYFFRNRKGKLVRKTVAFFVGETESTDVTISDEHVGYAFSPFELAVKQLNYANARDILKLADAFLTDSATGDKMA